MPKLIALTGLDYSFKKQAAALLADSLAGAGASVSIIDNAEQALKLPYPTWRLPGGCACCTLAFGLIDLINRIDTDVTIIAVSGAAMPDALAMVLKSLHSETVDVMTLALVDKDLWARAPYLAGELTTHADFAVGDVGEFDAMVADLT
ncbi:MAG: hypothetical protein SF123_19325 [Chloroflexota bacterium]|nr:hypothetical protein [Chloroflexota bacterium]